MAVLQPCATCWFRDKGCELRARMAERIKGLGLSVARFPCRIQTDEYRPGRRVRATIRGGTIGTDWSGDSQSQDIAVAATVIERSTKPGRFLIWPDDDTHEDLDGVRNEKKLCALRSRQLRPLDEPDQPERIAALNALDEAQRAAEAERGGF